VSTGEKRERRQGCQRLGRTGTVGRQRPRSRSPPATERTRGSKSVGARPAEADLGGVKRLVPRSSRADPKVRGAPTLRKGRSEPGTNEVRVHAVHVRVAEVDRTHFASCPPSGRKARWWNQQGASQKEAQKHGLTPGTSGEKAKQCAGARRRCDKKFARVHSVRGFRLAGSRDDGRHSRASAHLALTGRVTRGPSARRSTSVAPSARSVSRSAHRSTKRSVGRAFG